MHATFVRSARAVLTQCRTARRWLLGRELRFRRETDVATEFHGSKYGGWAILRDSLNASSRVISVGVGEDASFDLSLIERYGCSVHAFDPTPKSVTWARAHIHDPRFVMHEQALSDRDGPVQLFLPTWSGSVSASLAPGGQISTKSFLVPAVSLATLRAQLGFRDTVDILKMDIEGAEYGVVNQALRSGSLNGVRQLLIEFHHHLKAFGPDRTRGAMATLREHGWRVAWVSPSHHELLFVHAPS